MKIVSLLAAFSLGIFSSAYAQVDYYLEANTKSVGTSFFKGISNKDYAVVSPSGATSADITTADNLFIEWYAGIGESNIQANKLTFTASGVWGSQFEFKAGGSASVQKNIFIKAKTIDISVHKNNNGANYSTSNTDVTGNMVAYVKGNTALSLNGTLSNNNLQFHIADAGDASSGNNTLSLSGYDENTKATYLFNNICFNYGNASVTNTQTLNINDGAQVSAKFFFSSTGRNGNSVINLNGGLLNLQAYNGANTVRSNNDKMTINHTGTNLSIVADTVLNVNEGLTGASYSYNFGSNALFTVASGKTLTMGKNLILGSVAGSDAGLTLKGGGTISFAGDVSVINGNISIKEASTIKFASAPINAKKISIDAGASFKSVANVAFDSTVLELSINSDTSFAMASSDGSFSLKNVNFLVAADALKNQEDSISIELSSLIGAGSGTIDWTKLNITANTQWKIEQNVSGKDVITFSVPEPSAYAALFGMLALAFVAFKRRK